jgi:hypothetical protein
MRAAKAVRLPKTQEFGGGRGWFSSVKDARVQEGFSGLDPLQTHGIWTGRSGLFFSGGKQPTRSNFCVTGGQTWAITRSGMATASSGVFHQMYLLARVVKTSCSICIPLLPLFDAHSRLTQSRGTAAGADAHKHLIAPAVEHGCRLR